MGCGRIGQKVIELLQVFPVKVITYDIVFGFKEKEPWLIDLETKLKLNWVQISADLEEFLQKSDYITVHIPGIKENLGLLNYSKLQNIGWVVNLSRAGIVEEKDILKLLDEWKMEFYATDVVVWEPYIDKINKQLLKHEKVFITPHIGANTVQVQEEIVGEFLGYYL